MTGSPLTRPCPSDPARSGGERHASAARSLTIDSRRLSLDTAADRAHAGPALFVQCQAGTRIPDHHALGLCGETAHVSGRGVQTLHRLNARQLLRCSV